MLELSTSSRPDAVRGLLLGAITGIVSSALWAGGAAVLQMLESGGSHLLRTWAEGTLGLGPGSALAGALLGRWQARSTPRTGVYLLAAAGLAVLLFTVTALAWLVLTPLHRGGYAAEQGMRVLVIFLAPLYGLTAAPIWAAAAYLLRHKLTTRSQPRARAPSEPLHR